MTIPERIMEEARKVHAEFASSSCKDNLGVIIARALLAAEQRGAARERAHAATVAKLFTGAAHIAYDMRTGTFPKKSPLQDAIAAAIMDAAPPAEREREITDEMVEAGAKAMARVLIEKSNEVHAAMGRSHLKQSEAQINNSINSSWRLHEGDVRAALTAALSAITTPAEPVEGESPCA